MSRPRTKQYRHLPPYMHVKRGVFYLVTGSPRRWVPLGRDRHEAYAAYARLLPTAHRAGKTFAGLVAECVQSAAWAKIADRTRHDYEAALVNLLRAFGDAPPAQIQPHDVQRYMDARSSIHGANREKAVLSKILQFGVGHGWCRDNVARKIGYHATKARKRVITPAEWQAIKLAALDPLPVFMDLAFVTGLRVGDVLALRWANVREDGLYVMQAKNQAEGVYLLTDSLRDVLERARRLHGRSGKVAGLIRNETAIIHTKKLQPYRYSGIRSSWVRACARAGIEGIRIHDIRRTAITRAKQAGRDPQAFSLHKTAAQAAAYVVDVPKVVPMELMK